jgi:hypothetical protein
MNQSNRDCREWLVEARFRRSGLVSSSFAKHAKKWKGIMSCSDGKFRNVPVAVTHAATGLGAKLYASTVDDDDKRKPIRAMNGNTVNLALPFRLKPLEVLYSDDR